MIDNADHNKPGRVILGMDAGGTKTKVALADENGRIFDIFTGGGMNVNSFGVQVTGEHLGEILDEVKMRVGSLKKIAAVCVGVAGATNPSTQQIMNRVLKEKGVEAPTKIVGDHIIALYAANGTGEGMILIAGTGSVCFGRKVDEKGNEFLGRSGGWGHLIDDPGSGYYIGKEMLSEIVRAEDGREEPTILWPMLKEKTPIRTMSDLISFVYGKETGKKEIAAFSQIVQEAVRRQDAAALRITRKAAGELAELVMAVAKQMQQTEGSVMMNGGELTYNEPLRKMLGDILAEKLPGFALEWPKLDAAEGAVLAAMELI